MVFFQRMIAIADRECSQCEDTIEESVMYWKAKNEDIWCQACVEYEQQTER